MDVRLTDEQELLRRSIREFAEAELRPHVREWDEAQQFPPALLSKFAELGLMGIQFPESYGGAAMSSVDYCLCIEELARVDPSVCLSVAAHNGLGAAHIYMFGNESQKQQYLVPLARGEKLAAWALTEASSGSDAASMQTRAVRDGDSWIINGTKQFITHGATGDIMVVMAVTTRAKGSRGISAFIVERGTPGFRAGKKEDKLGMRASETSEVIFENCRVPDDQRLGPEGEGFIQAMRILDGGRIGIAALALGIAQGAFEASLRFAKQRRAFGRPIADQSIWLERIANCRVQIDQVRLLVLNAADKMDRLGNKAARREIAMIKVAAPAMLNYVVDWAIQAHGAAGVTTDFGLGHIAASARTMRIVDGPDEVHRNQIGKMELEKYKPAKQ